jgi:hypothetical protein
MAVTTPPPIDPVPTPAIQRNDRSTFSNRLDAFINWLVNAVLQFAALAANVFANATDAANSATVSATQAIQSAGSAQAAVAGSNAPIWVSGATYAIGDCRFSPSTFYTYRRKTAGAGTTDPAGDTTNWQVISSTYAVYYMNLREQQPAGTAPPSSGSGTITNAATARALNTVAANTIVGASLSGSNIILPAGSYQVRARAPGAVAAIGVTAFHKTALYNVTDGVVMLIGSSVQAGYTTAGSPLPATTDSWVMGSFSTSATKTFSLRHAFSVSGVLGAASTASAGGQLTEVWAEIEIFKVG